MKKIAALPAENARERNSVIGSIGSRARSSQATNAADEQRAGGERPRTSGLPQPAALPRTSAPDDPERAAP